MRPKYLHLFLLCLLLSACAHKSGEVATSNNVHSEKSELMEIGRVTPTPPPILSTSPSKIYCVFKKTIKTTWQGEEINSFARDSQTIIYELSDFDLREPQRTANGLARQDNITSEKHRYFLLYGYDATFFPIQSDSGGVSDMLTISPYRNSRGEFAASLTKQYSVPKMPPEFNVSQSYGWCKTENLPLRKQG